MIGFMTTGFLTTGLAISLGITNGEAFGLVMTLTTGFLTIGLAPLCLLPFCAVIIN
jgi:hypothetical protein